jgi:hypothetical protein
MTQQIRIAQINELSGGSDGQVIKRVAGVPAWADETTGVIPSGGAIHPPNNQSGTSAGWQNFTIFTKFQGPTLLCLPASWKVMIRFTAGSPVIGAMKILRTLTASTSVLDSTNVQIGGNSAPTLSSPTVVTTDTIALQLDRTHDYYFAIFLANNAANASVSVASNGSVNIVSGYASGDQSGVSTIPGLTTSNQPYLTIGGIVA